MGAHQTADRRGAEHFSLLLRLSAQQTGDRFKGHLLWQLTTPFLEATGDDHPPVGRPHGVAGQRVALGARICADLPRQVQQDKAAGHRDRLLPIVLDHCGRHLRAVPRH